MAQSTSNKQEPTVSLFDFLGKAAGAKLGKQVYEEAKKLNVPVDSRSVVNPKYNGKVLIYPVEFLKDFFKRRPNLRR